MGTSKENKNYYDRNKERLRRQSLKRYHEKREETLSGIRKRRESDPEFRAAQNERVLDYYHRNREEILRRIRDRRRMLTEEQKRRRREYWREYRRRRDADANS